MKKFILLGILFIILPLLIYFLFPVHTALGISYESLGYVTFSYLFTMCTTYDSMFAEPEPGVLQRIFPTWIFREGECSWVSPISIFIFVLIIAGFIMIVIPVLKMRAKAK